MAVFRQPRQRHFRQPNAGQARSIYLCLKKIRQGFLSVLRLITKLQTEPEPKIWEKRDRLGNTFFKVYDPASDRFIYLSSENEVRIWLEERYSHEDWQAFKQ